MERNRMKISLSKMGKFCVAYSNGEMRQKEIDSAMRGYGFPEINVQNAMRFFEELYHKADTLSIGENGGIRGEDIRKISSDWFKWLGTRPNKDGRGVRPAYSTTHSDLMAWNFLLVRVKQNPYNEAEYIREFGRLVCIVSGAVLSGEVLMRAAYLCATRYTEEVQEKQLSDGSFDESKKRRIAYNATSKDELESWLAKLQQCEVPHECIKGLGAVNDYTVAREDLEQYPIFLYKGVPQCICREKLLVICVNVLFHCKKRPHFCLLNTLWCPERQKLFIYEASWCYYKAVYGIAGGAQYSMDLDNIHLSMNDKQFKKLSQSEAGYQEDYWYKLLNQNPKEFSTISL